MLVYTLPGAEIVGLRASHRITREKREADRIKAVVLLATGWSAEHVAEVLQVDANTVRNHFRRYQAGGVEALLNVAYRGSSCELSDAERCYLDAHLQTHLYLTAKAVAKWVEDTFEVTYTESGMTALLHRLGYVYKKPKLIPGKADAEAQRAFLAEYDKLKHTKGEGARCTSWMPCIPSTIRSSPPVGSSAVRPGSPLQYRAQTPQHQRCDQPRTA